MDAGRVVGARGRGGWLWLAIGYLLAVKLGFALFVPPNADEAYYWLWGQHLQWSYLDHAPMVGWTSGLAGLIAGWSIFGLRLPAMATFAVIVWALHVMARLCEPSDPQRFFRTALALWLASPLFSVLTTLNYPDHLLICFSVLALMRFAPFIAARYEGREGRLLDLYLGALFLGLAALSKYNAIFLAVGLATPLLFTPKLRPLLRSPHLYGAMALTLAIGVPVLWWNMGNGFPTLELHAVDRFAGRDGSGFDLAGSLRLLLISALYLSPFLIWALARFLAGPRQPGQVGGLQRVGLWTFLASTLAMLLLAAWTAAARQVAPHWNVVAFIPFMLVAPLFVRSQLLIGLHVAYGALVLTLVSLYYFTAPLLADALGVHDRETLTTYGQPELAAAAMAAADANGAGLFAAIDLGRASKLAFGMGGDRDVISLGYGRRDQFDYWRDAGADAGKNVIIAAPAGTEPDRFARSFDEVVRLEPVHLERFGRPLADYDLMLGRGYRP